MSQTVNVTFAQPGMKMVLLVPLDLNMSVGKIASQTAHAAMVAGLKAQTQEGFVPWLLGGMKKVVLEVANQAFLENFEKLAQSDGIVTHLVRDEGFTEVPFGSCTALAIGPANSILIDTITGGLDKMGTTFNPVARVKELEALGEQHRELNGKLRMELDEARKAYNSIVSPQP